MQGSSGKALVTTAAATGGSPKAAELLQASLEQISQTSELGQVSLLSAEQRAKLSGLGLQRSNANVGSRRQSTVQMQSTGVGGSPP